MFINFFDWHRKGVTRYGCMAHVRRKICRCLNTDERSVEVVNLISELYWIESDCKIHFLSEDERRKERQQRALPVLDNFGK